MIKEENLKSICCMGAGNLQCRYLYKLENANKFDCLKKTKNKKIIDNLIKEVKNKKNYMPIGDNCPGIDPS